MQLKPPPMGYNAMTEPLDDRAFKARTVCFPFQVVFDCALYAFRPLVMAR